jgi:holin-like protein
MERLKGFLIILLCNLVGNLLIDVTGLPLPGAVLGLLILLVLLLSGRVRLDSVESAADALIALLMLFILPGGVNMMNSFHKFHGVVWQVILIVFVTSLLTLLSAAGVAQALAGLLKRKHPGAQGDDAE